MLYTGVADGVCIARVHTWPVLKTTASAESVRIAAVAHAQRMPLRTSSRMSAGMSMRMSSRTVCNHVYICIGSHTELVLPRQSLQYCADEDKPLMLKAIFLHVCAWTCVQTCVQLCL